MIPCAWLGLAIYGQRPRWLSSVTGRLRWGLMFKLMALIAIPYLGMQAFDVIVGGFDGLSWRPYSLFMILVVLLTTPLQCAGEEYGTRGLINRLLGQYGSARVSFWIGAIGSSAVFMLLHAAQDPYLNAFYFTFGMTACWMAWRTGGLEASIAMHVVNNVLAMSVLPFSDFSGIFERGAGSASARAGAAGDRHARVRGDRGVADVVRSRWRSQRPGCPRLRPGPSSSPRWRAR